jgi:hypothetical protein
MTFRYTTAQWERITQTLPQAMTAEALGQVRTNLEKIAGTYFFVELLISYHAERIKQQRHHCAKAADLAKKLEEELRCLAQDCEKRVSFELSHRFGEAAEYVAVVGSAVETWGRAAAEQDLRRFPKARAQYYYFVIEIWESLGGKVQRSTTSPTSAALGGPLPPVRSPGPIFRGSNDARMRRIAAKSQGRYLWVQTMGARSVSKDRDHARRPSLYAGNIRRNDLA